MRGKLLVGTIPLLLAIACFGRAWGQPVLVESHPENGAVVAHAPKEIRFRFNTTIQPRLTRLDLYELRGIGIPVPVQPKVSAPTDRLTIILPILHRGSYVLHYKVVGTDGHATSGTLSFTAGGY